MPLIKQWLCKSSLPTAFDDLLIALSSVALPDSTEQSLGVVQDSIKSHLESNKKVLHLLSSLCNYTYNLLQAETRKSSVGKNGLQLTTAGTHQLLKTILVEQRQLHQPKSTAKAVRQPNRSVQISSKVNKSSRADVTEETPVRDALMTRLRELASNGQNKTTGVDRQIRHIGHYVIRGSNVRAAQKATLQDVAASVRSFFV